MTDNLYINLAALKNDQHFQLFWEFHNVVIDFDPNELKILQLFEEWKVQFRLEDAALKKINRSPLTDEIRSADARRSQLFRGLTVAFKLSTIHYSDEVRTAAKPLQVVFETYGNLATKPLTEKTSAIFNLVQELRMHEEAVETAGLHGWIDELQISNGECQELMKNRWDETASRTKIVMRDARAAVDTAYEAIMRRILALREVEGSEIYDKFITRIEVVIDTYNAALSRRTKAGNSTAADEEKES